MVIMVHAIFFLPLHWRQWHLNQCGTIVLYCLGNSLVQSSRSRGLCRIKAKSVGKSHVVWWHQVGGDITAVVTPGLLRLHSSIGSIVEHDHNHVKLLLYCRRQLTHVEQEATITAEGNDGRCGSSSLRAQCEGQTTANRAEFRGMNIGARRIQREIF